MPVVSEDYLTKRTQSRITAWNRLHSIGTPVILRINGKVYRTRTTSQAFAFGVREAVVEVECRKNCAYSLDHIEAI